MKKHYMFAFTGGVVGIIANNEEEAIILAKAKAINIGFNYKEYRMWEPTKDEWSYIDMYLA